MSKKYSCPRCHQAIGRYNISLLKHKAFCQDCILVLSLDEALVNLEDNDGKSLNINASTSSPRTAELSITEILQLLKSRFNQKSIF